MKETNPISLVRCILISVLMLLCIGLLTYVSRSEAVPTKKALSDFPKQIGEWVGTESFFDQRVYDVLGVDDSTLIQYQGNNGRQVQLYVGYYQSQRRGDLIHSPKNCLPGSGWTITRTTLEDLTVTVGKTKNIKVFKLLLAKGGAKQVMLYWFQSRGRFIASEYQQKIYLVWDAITKNRTDGSFVRLIAPIGPEGMDHATTYLKTFAETLIPILTEYLPGEQA